ncbi:MAG: hypothetical protein JNM56_10160 [Planctomycetia bacterium]|nr:hypothetical protein [Planctomycetia bacterium]
MNPVTLERLNQKLQLADQLLAGRATMLEPQDLPGRYGRVIRAVDHLLGITQIEAVLGGGWAVWFHGYAGRVTQDLDVALPADRIEEFLQSAAVSGFELLARQEGRWPKMIHKETRIQVDILPEGARPGTPSRPAPTTIPHPSRMGASIGRLRYINLPCLIELKIAAGRARDHGDIVELLRVNADQAAGIRQHLAEVHPDYVKVLDELERAAREQQDP